jgi:hypothetical protein
MRRWMAAPGHGLGGAVEFGRRLRWCPCRWVAGCGTWSRDGRRPHSLESRIAVPGV